MTDDTIETASDSGVEPPNEDFYDDTAERDELVSDAMQQASRFHVLMDKAKSWSHETVSKLRVEAALAEDTETRDEIEQVADIVATINARIEDGDKSRARQP